MSIVQTLSIPSEFTHTILRLLHQTELDVFFVDKNIIKHLPIKHLSRLMNK